MTRARLAAGIAVGLAIAGTLHAQQVFRTGTDLVILTVSVVTGQGRPVPGLAQGDFHVFEDGRPQDVALFSAERLPVSLSILLDASTSMDTKIGVAREAATGFCQRLGPNDVAQVIAFAADVQIRQGFTNDFSALQKAVAETRPGGSTSLYTAIYVAINELRTVRRRQNADEIRRQAIVVLSDGEDTASLLDYEEVVERAKHEDIVVYAIGLRARGEVAPTRGFSESDYVLRTLAQTTGGRAFFASEVQELPAIYNQIAEELSSQYAVGYISKNTRRDGTWRQVAVRVDHPNVVARTRAGYFAPTAPR